MLSNFSSIEKDLFLFNTNDKTKLNIESKIITEGEDKQKPEKLYCKYCENFITQLFSGISAQGYHEHIFHNKANIVFHLGCFAQAKGCVPIGEPIDDYSWFAGYFWQINLCVKCLNHLGWKFTSDKKESFYALVLNKLILR